MRTIIAFKDCWTSIPYFAEGDDPTTKHQFVDLRSETERVDELPEVAKIGILRDLLL